MGKHGDELFTSTLTLGEALVKPLAQGDYGLAAALQKGIASSSVLIAFDNDAAWPYARLRKDRSLRALMPSSLPAPRQ